MAKIKSKKVNKKIMKVDAKFLGWVRVALALIVLTLVWMALDDITTGTESNYVLEYLMVGGGITALGIIGFWKK